MAQDNDMKPLLEVKNLRTSFFTETGTVRAVDDVSFSVYTGKTLGIVGESGCGKSVTALSIMRLIPDPPGRIAGGEVLFNGRDLVKLPINEMYKIRGGDIAMIFQEPMTALNPVLTVEQQVCEAIGLHLGLDRTEGRLRALDMLKKVGIPSPETRMRNYPNELSGGMIQRVMIAMALSCNPSLLIADEPTTALDVTIQAQILALMNDMKRDTGAGIIFITHDLGVVAAMCDEVIVMYAGKVMEQASVEELFASARHPYTKGLLSSIPRLTTPKDARLTEIPGTVPDLLDLPTGCLFQNRCPWAKDICRKDDVPMESLAGGRKVRCLRHREVNA
jgi:oligopeptide/dipeptide ABC transporter ATP-binding protein